MNTPAGQTTAAVLASRNFATETAVCGSKAKASAAQVETAGCDDSQRTRFEQSVEFLRSQHQELVGCLHEEIERLQRKNRGPFSSHYNFVFIVSARRYGCRYNE